MIYETTNQTNTGDNEKYASRDLLSVISLELI